MSMASKYYLKEVNGPLKDSSSFTISITQLDSLFARARQVGFFSLNNSYHSTKVDGGGIYISMNHAGTKKSGYQEYRCTCYQ